jgi:ABC-type transporter Mla MlaB component
VTDAQIVAETVNKCAGCIKVRIDAGALQTVDTAYLQLLRTMLRGFQAQGTPATLERVPEPLHHLMKLYGFDIESNEL